MTGTAIRGAAGGPADGWIFTPTSRTEIVVTWDVDVWSETVRGKSRSYRYVNGAWGQVTRDGRGIAHPFGMPDWLPDMLTRASYGGPR